MLDPTRLKYHEDDSKLEYTSGIDGRERLPEDIGRELGRIARERTWDGKAVNEVVVSFGSEAGAAHNADALSYLGVGVAHPGGRVRSTLRFVARTDFGIDEE